MFGDITKYLEQQYPDMISFLYLQESLIDLNLKNYHLILHYILSSNFVQDKNLLTSLIENILITLSIRPKLRDLLIELVKDLIKNSIRSIALSKFKLELLNSIFRPIVDWKFLLKIPLFHFLRSCYLKGVISIAEIASAIKKMILIENEFPNISSLVYCFFAPYLEYFDSSLYQRLNNSIRSQEQDSFYNLYLKPFSSTLDKLKENNWELLESLIEGTHSSFNLINAIKYDDVNTLSELTSIPNFNFNRQLVDQPFEPCLYLQGGLNPIQYSAFYGSINCFKYISLHKPSLRIFDRRHRPLSFFATAGGNSEIIRYLENQDISFKGCIKIAALFKRHDLFQWLYESRSFEIENIQNELNRILSMSSRINNLYYVIFSLKNGADINTRIEGLPPFLSASLNGHFEILKYLSNFKGYSLYNEINDGKNAIHFVVRSGRLDSLKFLINLGVFDLNSKASDGSTPLHIATKYGQREIVNFLLYYNGVNPNILDLNGSSPLDIALSYSKNSVLKCFEGTRSTQKY